MKYTQLIFFFVLIFVGCAEDNHPESTQTSLEAFLNSTDSTNVWITHLYKYHKNDPFTAGFNYENIISDEQWEFSEYVYCGGLLIREDSVYHFSCYNGLSLREQNMLTSNNHLIKNDTLYLRKNECHYCENEVMDACTHYVLASYVKVRVPSKNVLFEIALDNDKAEKKRKSSLFGIPTSHWGSSPK